MTKTPRWTWAAVLAAGLCAAATSGCERDWVRQPASPTARGGGPVEARKAGGAMDRAGKRPTAGEQRAPQAQPPVQQPQAQAQPMQPQQPGVATPPSQPWASSPGKTPTGQPGAMGGGPAGAGQGAAQPGLRALPIPVPVPFLIPFAPGGLENNPAPQATEPGAGETPPDPGTSQGGGPSSSDDSAGQLEPPSTPAPTTPQSSDSTRHEGSTRGSF